MFFSELAFSKSSFGSGLQSDSVTLILADSASSLTSDNIVLVSNANIDLVISEATSSHLAETFGLSVAEDTYQKCSVVITSDPTRVDGLSTFTNIELPIKWVDIPATMKDGSATSISYGGGNLRAYKQTPYTDANRLPLKVNSFDLINETCSVSTVLPSLSSINPKDIHLVRIAAQEVQPAASDPFGSGAVDSAVVYPDNADTTSTLYNAANDDDFFSTGTVSCETIGNDLTVVDSTHGHGADNVALGLDFNVIDALHSHTADNIILLQDMMLILGDSTHDHITEELSLVQSYNLICESSIHTHQSDEPWVRVPPGIWAEQQQATTIWTEQ